MDTPWKECKNGDDLEAQEHRVAACAMDPYIKIETDMNSAFLTSARNPDPVTSQESAVAIPATLEGYHRQTIEVLRPDGPMTQK